MVNEITVERLEKLKEELEFNIRQAISRELKLFKDATGVSPSSVGIVTELDKGTGVLKQTLLVLKVKCPITI